MAERERLSGNAKRFCCLGSHAVSDAEKGKVSTGIAVYVALLWVFDLLNQLADVADPGKDEEGQALSLASERLRARSRGELDNDF